MSVLIYVHKCLISFLSYAFRGSPANTWHVDTCRLLPNRQHGQLLINLSGSPFADSLSGHLDSTAIRLPTWHSGSVFQFLITLFPVGWSSHVIFRNFVFLSHLDVEFSTWLY